MSSPGVCCVLVICQTDYKHRHNEVIQEVACLNDLIGLKCFISQAASFTSSMKTVKAVFYSRFYVATFGRFWVKLFLVLTSLHLRGKWAIV